MILDRGIAEVWRESASTPSGSMPKVPKQKVFSSYYGERTVGFTRYFTALAHDDQIDLLVRIQRFGVTTADKIILQPVTEDGTAGTYNVVQVQHITDEDGLLMTDLSLERTEGVDEPDGI